MHSLYESWQKVQSQVCRITSELSPHHKREKTCSDHNHEIHYSQKRLPPSEFAAPPCMHIIQANASTLTLLLTYTGENRRPWVCSRYQVILPNEVLLLPL